MKYTIEGFDQKTAIEYGLDVTDLTILRWFVDFMHSDRMAKVHYEGKEYCWVKYDGLLADMPILGIQKKMLAIRLNKLVEAGVLIHETKKEGGTYSLYAIGSNYINLINSGGRQGYASDGVVNKLDTVGKKIPTGRKNISQGVGNLLDTPSEINCLPKDYSTKKDSSTKENYSTRNINKEPKSSSEKTAPMYYPYDEKLNQTFLDFLEMRKACKKPAKTDRTIQLLMNSLKKLATVKNEVAETEYFDNDLAIRIIEQSIERSWQGFFPLKDDKAQTDRKVNWDNV